MRSFYFTSRIIGQERYLTYTMGAETELDEDVLDYCEENLPEELLPIIYEEDDDYDYLTYDVSARVSLESFMQHEMTQAGVLTLLKNIAQGLISVKEQAIHLSYILLNKSFVFVDENDLSISFICLPVESKASLSVEFKSFVRQILAYMRYDVEEDLNYVGKLLTYINGDNFNLRGLIGLTEALMEEAGIDFEEEETTSDDGIEIVNLGPVEENSGDGVSNFMSGGNSEDVPLPEIGDDEEEGAEAEAEAAEEESADALFAGMTGVLKKKAEEAEAARMAAEAGAQETPAEETPADETEAGSEEEPEASEAEEPEAAVAPGESEVLREKTKKAMVSKIKEKMADSSVKFETATDDEEEASEDKKEEAPAKEETNKTGLKGITGIGGGAPKIVHPLPIEGVTTGPTISMKKTIKVNRAAMIQSHAAEATTDGDAASDEEQTAAAAAPAAETAESATPAAEPAVSAATETPAPEEPEVKKTKTKTVTPPKALPYLIRVSTKEIIMLNKPQFKLGKASRGVDFSISGNGAVSRQHAVIIQRDGEVFIKDNKSTNHTYVNGNQIDEGVEVPLTHDADIMLGDEEFKFKIR